MSILPRPLQSIVNLIDRPIDFKGQRRCENFMFYGLIIGYVLSLFIGFLKGNLVYTLYGGVLTVGAIGLLTLFPWGFYRLNPMKFKKSKKVD